MLDAGGDLASYTQAVWLIGRGDPARLTLLDVDLLDLHGSFILYPLALLARLPVPLAETLVVVQSAALAVTVLPLWLLARRDLALRVGATTCLVVAYLFHPLVQQVNVADFHPEALAIPALVAMTYWARTGSTVRYALAAAFAVACRADLALVVAGAGVLVAVSGRRRLGVATAAVGGAVDDRRPVAVLAGRRRRRLVRGGALRALRRQPLRGGGRVAGQSARHAGRADRPTELRPARDAAPPRGPAAAAGPAPAGPGAALAAARLPGRRARGNPTGGAGRSRAPLPVRGHRPGAAQVGAAHATTACR